jgi:hypothetical protein
MEGQGVHAWAVESDLDPARLASMTADVESTPSAGASPARVTPIGRVIVTLSAAMPRFTLG